MMESQEQKRRGALIVVEGLDRAGKTSQCHLLVEALAHRGYEVEYKKFPGIKTHFYLRHSTKSMETETRLLGR
jgi:thymidylate kinase